MSYLDTNDAARCWLADQTDALLNAVETLHGILTANPELARSAGPHAEQFQFAIDSLPEVHVWPSHMEQAYGGGEEGGWWYDTHAPITDPISKRERCVRKMRIDKAGAFVRRANDLAEHIINSKRPRYTSVRSKGVVLWVWTFDPPTTDPRKTPRYE